MTDVKSLRNQIKFSKYILKEKLIEIDQLKGILNNLEIDLSINLNGENFICPCCGKGKKSYDFTASSKHCIVCLRTYSYDIRKRKELRIRKKMESVIN